MGEGAMNEPLYVCVHLPEFATQALIRLRPELAHLPVVVLAGEPPFDQVCSASIHALRLGITYGMSRAELDSFTGLTVLRRSEAQERSARAVLLEAAGAFTPRIEVRAFSPSAFVMVLDMTGTSLIFGPVDQSLNRIANALSGLRFLAHLAASANFHAAVCLAPAAHKKPAIIPRDSELDSLSPLPLAALNLTAQQAETLQLWGLRTLGELAALPEVELVVRMGQEGRRLRLLARGEHPHLMTPEEPVFTLTEFLTFDAAVESMESLLFVLGPMLDQLLTRARNRALALASVTVTLGLDCSGKDSGGRHERTIKPALPVLQREVLLKLLHLDFEVHPPPAGVVSIAVSAEPGAREKIQLGIFAPQLPEPLRLDVTLARIAALVGEERVGCAKLSDTHRPGCFTMERFIVSAASAAQSDCADSLSRHAVALRRCRPPIVLPVRHEADRLASFSLHGKRYEVQEAYGPWRKSGDWWSADVWSFEEWDVRAAAAGNVRFENVHSENVRSDNVRADNVRADNVQADDVLLCLITHDLLNRVWQLEALYD